MNSRRSQVQFTYNHNRRNDTRLSFQPFIRILKANKTSKPAKKQKQIYLFPNPPRPRLFLYPTPPPPLPNTPIPLRLIFALILPKGVRPAALTTALLMLCPAFDEGGLMYRGGESALVSKEGIRGNNGCRCVFVECVRDGNSYWSSYC